MKRLLLLIFIFLLLIGCSNKNNKTNFTSADSLKLTKLLSNFNIKKDDFTGTKKYYYNIIDDSLSVRSNHELFMYSRLLKIKPYLFESNDSIQFLVQMEIEGYKDYLNMKLCRFLINGEKDVIKLKYVDKQYTSGDYYETAYLVPSYYKDEFNILKKTINADSVYIRLEGEDGSDVFIMNKNQKTTISLLNELYQLMIKSGKKNYW